MPRSGAAPHCTPRLPAASSRHHSSSGRGAWGSGLRRGLWRTLGLLAPSLAVCPWDCRLTPLSPSPAPTHKRSRDRAHVWGWAGAGAAWRGRRALLPGPRPLARCRLAHPGEGVTGPLKAPVPPPALILTQTAFAWQTLFFSGKTEEQMYLLGWKGPLDNMANTRVSNKYARTFGCVGRPSRSLCSGLCPHTCRPTLALGGSPAQSAPGCTEGRGPGGLPTLRERDRGAA